MMPERESLALEVASVCSAVRMKSPANCSPQNMPGAIQRAVALQRVRVVVEL